MIQPFTEAVLSSAFYKEASKILGVHSYFQHTAKQQHKNINTIIISIKRIACLKENCTPKGIQK